MKELAESSGFLPKIKASDEGKFLSVNNGKPVWNTGAGGSSLVVSVNRVDESTLELDKTWSEIKSAVDNNIPIIVKEDFSSGDNEDYYISIGLLYSIAGGETYSVACALDAEGWYVIRMFYADNPDDHPKTT